MGKSYTNDITVEDVAIAIEHVLVAPYGTAWTPGRVDISSPPANFYHLGAVQEDTPQVTIQKEPYRLMTGIPRALQYQAIIGMQGQFQVTYLQARNSILYHTLGGQAPYHLPSTPTSTWAQIMSSAAATVSRWQVVVVSNAHVSSLTAGQLVATDTTANINTTINEAFVTSIAAFSSTGYSIYLSNPDGFRLPPTALNPLFVVAHNRYPLGTNLQPFFRILGVADFLNGAQVIHDFQRVQPSGQLQDAFRNGQDARAVGSYDLFGYTVSTPYSASSSQLILGERFWFNPTSVGL